MDKVGGSRKYGPKISPGNQGGLKKKGFGSQAWWHVPVISAFGRPRQEDHCELEASLGYRVSLRLV